MDYINIAHKGALLKAILIGLGVITVTTVVVVVAVSYSSDPTPITPDPEPKPVKIPPYIEFSFEVFEPASEYIYYDNKARIDKTLTFFSNSYTQNYLNMSRIEMYIDGKKQPKAVNEVIFDKIGNYTLRYIIPDGLTNMEEIFYHLNFVRKISFGDINVEKVESLTRAFQNCASLEEIEGLERLNFTNLQYASSVFQNDYLLKKINIGGILQGKLKDISFMFYYCTSLVEIKWNSNINTTGLNFINQAFSCCDSLPHVDLSAWDIYNCYSINEVFYIDNYKGKVTEVTFKDKAQYEYLKNKDSWYDLDAYIKAVHYLIPPEE